MISIASLEDIPAELRGGVLSIGNFDGLHRGHARLLERLRIVSERASSRSFAVTFDPHPISVLRPDRAPVPLLWPDRKASLLLRTGVSDVVVFRTGSWLLDLTAREFFERVIVDRFAVKGLVEGPTFTFGRDRLGNSRLLAEWCRSSGIPFEVAEATEFAGETVSSSRIRASLAEGEVEEAAEMLGRPHRLRGVVTRGAARGSGLGFPTANLDAIDTLIPGDGVYAALAYVEGAPPAFPAACHIGPNVSFGENARKLEAHLIDFQGDLYGRSLELDFLRRLRPIRRFEGVEELLAQIRSDVAATLEIVKHFQEM